MENIEIDNFLYENLDIEFGYIFVSCYNLDDKLYFEIDSILISEIRNELSNELDNELSNELNNNSINNLITIAFIEELGI
jgi:hypothetical protein